MRRPDQTELWVHEKQTSAAEALPRHIKVSEVELESELEECSISGSSVILFLLSNFSYQMF